MITYSGFQFAAPPHTGVPWFVRVCEAVGMGSMANELAFYPFPKHDGKLLRVTLVRHPCAWLEKYYRRGLSFKGKIPQSIPGHDLFRQLDRDLSWDEFLRRYLNYCPGVIGKFFAQYQADSVIRYEDLPAGFFDLMRSLGVDCDRYWPSSVYLATPTRKAGRLPIRWHPVYRSDLLESEKQFCSLYDYH
jgi:hypothetical protein